MSRAPALRPPRDLPIRCRMKALLLLATVLASAMQAHADPVQNVTAEAAAKVLAERKDVVVIDLRTDVEFKEGHIAGAKNIDFLGTDFAKQVDALDKGKTYLVHCGSGRRSTKSLEIFQSQKFTSILHLNEGFKAWEAAGKPVEK